jgi:hypothetical protein
MQRNERPSPQRMRFLEALFTDLEQNYREYVALRSRLAVTQAAVRVKGDIARALARLEAEVRPTPAG